MKSPLTVENDLEFLYPAFGASVIRAVELANKYARKPDGTPKFNGFRGFGVFETYRSPARQLMLFTNKITPVRVSNYHSVGLAADIVWYDADRKPRWDGDAALWQLWGHCARSVGMVWGGDWKSRDLVHVQCTLPQRVLWLSKSRRYLRGLGYETA